MSDSEHSDSEHYARMSDILNHALDLPPERRNAYVEEACGDDRELRKEVESLLGREDALTRFLDSPFAVPAGPDPTPKPSDSLAGRRIGAYRLVREIGRGGMGAVWLGERADGAFEQRVAVKLMRGILSESDRERFEHERQILASIENPNIARLLDGGATEDGIPYLVMELVEGERIDDYVKQHELSVGDTVELMIQVCRAVESAHEQQIVHRDLKPSNILINERREPRLLDFGIAKALDPESDPSLTRTGQRVHTPRYASPEQLDGAAVTTATDVHALGVVLFELLTGSWPFGEQSVEETDIEERVRRFPARRPSEAVVCTTSSAASDTRTRESVRRRRELAGDLDTIVLRSVRKEPERRYPDARAFREDLERYSTGRPVLARPDSLFYRTRKYVGRHRGVATAVGLAVVAVTLALALTSGNSSEVGEFLGFRCIKTSESEVQLEWSESLDARASLYRVRHGDRVIGEFQKGETSLTVGSVSSGFHQFTFEVLGATGSVLSSASRRVEMGRVDPDIVDSGWRLERYTPLEFWGEVMCAPHFGSDGSVYVVRRYPGRGAISAGVSSPPGVLRLRPDAKELELIVEFEHKLSGLAVDLSSDVLFVCTDVDGGKVTRCSVRQRERVVWVDDFGPGDDDPVGIALVPAYYRGKLANVGDAIVTDRGNRNADRIWRVSTADPGETELLYEDARNEGPLDDVLDVAVGSEHIYLADRNAERIFILGEERAIRECPVDEPIRPTGIAFDPSSGNLFVADVTEGRDAHMLRIVQVTPSSGSVEPVIDLRERASFPWNCIDVSHDGRRLVTLDCGGLYVFQRR